MSTNLTILKLDFAGYIKALQLINMVKKAVNNLRNSFELLN